MKWNHDGVDYEIDVIPCEGGFYAEVDRAGEKLHTTRPYLNAHAARAGAVIWIEDHCFRVEVVWPPG